MRKAHNRSPFSRRAGVLLAIAAATVVSALFGVPHLSSSEAMPTSATAPPAPPQPVPSDVAATSLSLSWSPGGSTSGIVGYDVFENGTNIGQPATDSFTPSDLKCATTY
jgi:membrane protease YdiL (CAAX protease family)